jgi:hypothetical protein
LLEGDEVVLPLLRLTPVRSAPRPQRPASHGLLLSFKGERGSNPARVFAELATELELMPAARRRTQVVHLFTHAALYIPRETIQALRQLAHVAAVFILPSGGALQLDYLDLLDAHWVVDHDTLSKREERSNAARSILGESDALRRGIDALESSEPAGPSSVRGPGSRRPGAHEGGGPMSERPPRAR